MHNLFLTIPYIDPVLAATIFVSPLFLATLNQPSSLTAFARVGFLLHAGSPTIPERRIIPSYFS